MGINTFGKLFMPKNQVFYELFEDVAITVEQMAQLLRQFVSESDRNKRVEILSKLEDLEHHNDDNTHNIFTELSRNFITPFDREDIHYLAKSLDDIADYIYGTSKKINIYNVNPNNDSGIQKLAELLIQSTAALKTAVYGLRDLKNLRQMTDAMIKINSIENNADDVFDMSIQALFEQENDIKELIKKKEIYKMMEGATDMCEDAANAIESIIVKYA